MSGIWNVRIYLSKATVCFFFVSRYTRSLIFSNSRKKIQEKNKNSSYVLRLRHIAHGLSRTGRGGYSLSFNCLWLHAKTAVVQDLCLAQGDYEERDLPRKVWPQTGALVRRQITQRWIQVVEDVWVRAFVCVTYWQCNAGFVLGQVTIIRWSLWGFFLSFVFFFLSCSLIDFSHPCNEKQRKNTPWPKRRKSTA